MKRMYSEEEIRALFKPKLVNNAEWDGVQSKWVWDTSLELKKDTHYQIIFSNEGSIVEYQMNIIFREIDIYDILDYDGDNVVNVTITQNDISVGDEGELFVENGTTIEIYEL